MALNARALHPLFAGEIGGVVLREVHDRAVLDEIKALLDRYGLVVFRDQPFEDEEQIAFARRLDGELVMKVARTVIDTTSRLNAPGITDISNLDENGAPLDRADRRRMYSLGNRLWHTDASFQNPPARYSMLSAKSVPDADGETE
ncbi:MAG: taurine catabolism dioxygenase tauD/tfdA, partial [Candidatus Eremiobacteraeota bacterium]|nr:taurine catabolism dioxygenase tauD/tfdA [Candidatus Eremiobacteraeota bacterium]